jgi:hypothetical protein
LGLCGPSGMLVSANLVRKSESESRLSSERTSTSGRTSITAIYIRLLSHDVHIRRRTHIIHTFWTARLAEAHQRYQNIHGNATVAGCWGNNFQPGCIRQPWFNKCECHSRSTCLWGSRARTASATTTIQSWSNLSSCLTSFASAASIRFHIRSRNLHQHQYRHRVLRCLR